MYKILAFFIVVVLSFPAARSLLKPGFYDTHDGLLHLERFLHFEKAIEAGQIIPRWAADSFAGFGTPIFNFNWNFPYYLGFALHKIGLSYTEIFKSLMLFSIILSGVFMFLWLEEKIGKWPAITSAIFYIYTPYRFLDIYVRGALGEALAFIFIPLIFWTLDNSYKKKFFILGSLSFAGFILTHNAFALIMLFVYLSYILSFSRWRGKISYYWEKFSLLLFGLGLSAFLWLPAILENKFIYYSTFAEGELYFAPLLSLIRSKWEGGSVFNGQKIMVSFQIGLTQLLVLLLLILLGLRTYLFKRKRLKEERLILFFFIWFFIALFFLAEISRPIWLALPLFNNFVFTFRILFLVCFSTAVLAGLLVKNLPFKILTIPFFIFLVIFANRNHVRSQPQQVSMGKIWERKSSLDIGGEFLPKWIRVEKLEDFYKNPRKELEIVDGKGEIFETERLPLKTTARVSVKEDVLLRFKRLYFPGWHLRIGSQTSEILFQEKDDEGVIYARIPKGESKVILEFKNTLPRMIGNLTSLISVLFLIINRTYVVTSYCSSLRRELLDSSPPAGGSGSKNKGT